MYRHPIAGAPAALPWMRADLLREWFSEQVHWPDGTRLIGLRCSRVWPGRSGVTFEIMLDFDTAEGRRSYPLQCTSRPLRKKRRIHPRLNLQNHELHGLRLYHEQLGLWCWTPDRDPDLPGVRTALSHHGRRHLLDSEPIGPARIVGYRARKRCVLHTRVTPDAGYFIKILRRGWSVEQRASLYQVAEELQRKTGNAVRLVTPAAQLGAPGIWVFEEAPGRAVEEGDVSALAQTISALQRLDPCRVQTYPPNRELEILTRWARLLQTGGHPGHGTLATLLADLEGGCPENGVHRLVHRDLYGRQLMRDGDTIWILDLDTLAVAHPEVDIATAAAHLALDALVDGESRTEALQRIFALVHALRENGSCANAVRLRFYLPSALARLGAVQTFREVPPEVGPELWALAGVILSGGGGW